MAELPTTDELFAERADLEKPAADNDKTVEEYQNKALSQVKRDLEDQRDILWSRVYDSSSGDYFTDEDGNARNKDRIHKMLNLLTVALVYKDYSITVTDSGYWDIHNAYMEEYMRLVRTAKLDVDRNEDGEITESEEETGQTFLRR